MTSLNTSSIPKKPEPSEEKTASSNLNNHKIYLDEELAEKYAKKFEVEGLCCSFAMDYAKKRLANKALSAETYKLEKRIKKIAKRHAEQLKGEDLLDGLKRVASAYGMKIGEDAYSGRANSFGKWECKGNGHSFVIVYVTVLERSGERHGFTIDARTSTVYLADSGFGVYSIANSNLGAVIKLHLEKLNQEFTFIQFHCLTLSLKSGLFRRICG